MPLSFRRLLLPVSCLVLVACGRVTIDLGAGARTVYSPLDHLPPEVEFQYSPTPAKSRFEIRTSASWILWGIPLNHPDWRDLMETELQDSEAIGNLVIQTRHRVGDVAITLLTLGLYRTCQVIIRGDRVQFVTPHTPRPTPGTDPAQELQLDTGP
jgi:hypothetical protein